MRRVVALVVILGVTAGFAGFAGVAGASRAVVESVAVVTCPTVVGAAGPAPPPLAAERVSVPRGLAGRVALYVDRYHRTTPVLALAGWKCRAVDAGDGQSGVEVIAPGGAANGLVAASWDGPCYLCVVDDVCHFTTVSAFRRGGPSGPPCPAGPAGETVRFVRGTPNTTSALVELSEPPGARITYGATFERPPTALATSARMSYDLAAPDARVVTCALVRAEAALCSTILARVP